VFIVIVAAAAMNYQPPAPVEETTTTNVEDYNATDDMNMTTVDTNTTMASCQPRYVTVKNDTGREIYLLHVREPGTTEYGGDLLGSDTILAGHSRPVDVGQTSCSCNLEVRAEFQGDTPYDYNAFDVCSSTSPVIDLGGAAADNTSMTGNTM
jgi:hypothetical protein